MVLKTNGSGGKRGSRIVKITGGVGGSGGTTDYSHLPVVDGSDPSQSDTAKEQRRVRAAGKRKAQEDLDPKENQFQLAYHRPSSMPSHISLGAPVTHKDLTPTFLADAKVQVKRPNFIWWFIATFPYQVSLDRHPEIHTDADFHPSAVYPPVADGIQRTFTCTACHDGQVGRNPCSWFQDLLEVYIHEAYQLNVGEAHVLASSKENDPQATLSTYYQTWLAGPLIYCSDGELGQRPGALGTVIPSECPNLSSRASPAECDALQPASHQLSFTQLPPLEPKPKARKCIKLMAPTLQSQHPPAQSSPPPGPSTPAAVRFSPGGSWLSLTMPERTSSLPPLLTRNPPAAGFDHNFPANYFLTPAKFSPPAITPTVIAASETWFSTPQTHSPAQVDDLDAISQHHPDNFVDTYPDNLNACAIQASAGADPRSPSSDIVRLKSDMANLSDGLAMLAMEDPSFQPEFSYRQEAESSLLKMLQGSLQTFDFLRSIVDEQNSRHITIARSLEDTIRLLTLENEQLKKGVVVERLEQKICLLKVENNQLRDSLIHQDQELEDGRLQGSVMKDLEQKMRQLEVKKEQLQGKLAQQEQAIASMNIRMQLADHVLQLASPHDLLTFDDTQTPDPVADTNLRDLVSMIHLRLDGSQPTLATKRFDSLEPPMKAVAMQMGQT
ncbi:hypothetical protein P692DRAFT_20820879 [Suillus brevipes Sb2]|nr:hypothetical protein P692DRAFT_20820879 [Suillus brevipes Sb2]